MAVMKPDPLLDASFMASAFESGLEPWQVARIIEVIAEIDETDFEEARRKCVRFWEQECFRAAEERLTTEHMWARLVRIALKVRP
jgi:hypothetical protein